MITVRENWSARRLSLRWPWNAYREFTVAGASTEAIALTAVDPVSGLAIPKEKDGHVANVTRILCLGPEVKECVGTDYWTIGCNYQASDTGGTGSPDHTDDPLLEPAEIQWDHAEVSEAVDRDVIGRPILNSAGLPFEAQPSRDTPFKKFTIVKNFPFFDLTLCATYDNTVNSAAISLGMGISAAEQHLRCVSIIPAAPYRATATFVPVAFSFELVALNTLGLYPFQHRIMDVGREGWTSGGKHKPFSVLNDDTGKFDPIDSPIRLNGTGVPIIPLFANVKVGDAGSTPAAPITQTNTYQKETTLISGSTNTAAVFLYFQKTRVVDMSPLLALL
jgi:hypothetical protein